MKPGALTWMFAALGLLLAGPAHAADTVYYYSSDTIHSEVVVTDANRNVVERTHYAPYGQVLDRDLRDGPGYTGHEEDPETSLVYMQQRYYDPEAGRFLSTDPVQADGGGGSFNRYEYANNNPYRFTDPTGMCTGTHICDGDLAVSTGAYTTGAAAVPLAMLLRSAPASSPQRSSEVPSALATQNHVAKSPSSNPMMVASNSDSRNNTNPAIKKKELILLFSTIAKEIQIAALHGKIPTEWIETGKDIGEISGGIMAANMAGGKSSFEMFQAMRYSPNPSTAYINWPINWSNVDWAKFSSPDETYPQALLDFGKYSNAQMQQGHP